jgi:hypothetical protein
MDIAAMTEDHEGLFALIQQHLSWYPLMEPRDVYKLLYQGVMGSEHLVDVPEDFVQRLRMEFDRLIADPAARLLEPVRPDKSLLRFNLCAYKCMQTNLDQLVPVFLETARQGGGTEAELQAGWTFFVSFCDNGRIKNYPIGAVHKFTSWLEKVAFPPVHHSETYRWAYQPSYRLISTRLLSSLELMGAVRV